MLSMVEVMSEREASEPALPLVGSNLRVASSRSAVQDWMDSSLSNEARKELQLSEMPMAAKESKTELRSTRKGHKSSRRTDSELRPSGPRETQLPERMRTSFLAVVGSGSCNGMR